MIFCWFLKARILASFCLLSLYPVPIKSQVQERPRWQPKPFSGHTWQWQIGSVPGVNELLDVDMYNVDLFETPRSTIQAMKNRDIKVVCYFSAGTYEGWREDWARYFDFIKEDFYQGNVPPFLGKMAEWDERWLDVREIGLLAPIMRGRMRLAREKGCDAVEPDNMDSYTNLKEVKPKGSYTAAHQLAYNKAVASWAHEEGLSVGLKNDLDQLEDLVDHYDWALNEQCYEYRECDRYDVFIKAGKAVFGVEYSGDTSRFCPSAYESGYAWLKKKLDLNEWVEACPVKKSALHILPPFSGSETKGFIQGAKTCDAMGRKPQTSKYKFVHFPALP